MKLQFDANQDYQLAAVQAVVKVFEGQPLASGGTGFAIGPMQGLLALHEFGLANDLGLSDDALLANVLRVQLENSIEATQQLQGRNFSVEMETGTGKTYVYLRTIFELSQRYGWKKFIVAVPSIAIREGVLKSLEITHEHFRELYGNTPYDYYVYDSKKIGRLRSFATANTIQILVMNIDAFRGADRVINQFNDRLSGHKPIDFVRATRPVVILDEPQNMESDRAREAIDALNPLCTLRYSATHREYYNLLYSLNPVQAYDQGLVKRIEVSSVREDNAANDAYIEVVSIAPQRSHISAKLKIEVAAGGNVKKKQVTVSTQAGKVFDLFELSGGREQYRGYVLQGLDAEDGTARFDNGMLARTGHPLGQIGEAIIKEQIHETIKRHLDKEVRLVAQGIKVISLFFVDRVSNYRDYESANGKGKFALWFEEIYSQLAAKQEYAGLNLSSVELVHNGYFAQDKHGKWKDTEGKSEDDQDAYDLIMRDKERLLSLGEPLRFIFSHSALREGWDNPNVFQICTLNETSSLLKKRQEIGRGLRLAVNQEGARVFDQRINVLTVIANESYVTFARQLQQEIEDETSVSFGGRIKDARRRRLAKLRKGYELDKNFLDLWNRIKQQTTYRVSYDSAALTRSCIEAIQALPPAPAPTVVVERAGLVMTDEGVEAQIHAVQQGKRLEQRPNIPDVVGYLSAQTGLTRSTVARVILKSGKSADILRNPQYMLDHVVAILKRKLEGVMVDGIVYRKLVGEEYAMSLFASEEIESYIDNMLKVEQADKTLYDHVVFDSDIEQQFALDLESIEDVKFYLKLPGWFKIETPIGTYNPDWAVVFEGDRRIYFVAETKGTNRLEDLPLSEQQKIKCGQRHFEQLDDVMFVAPITNATQLNSQ